MTAVRPAPSRGEVKPKTIAAADPVGMLVGGRYELVRRLGEGGQSVVYRARDHESGRDVAVKMLVMGAAQSREYAARLAREQEALVILAGTSAVAVYDLCRAPNGCLCLVMELLEGFDFERMLGDFEQRRERLSLPKLSAILDPIVDTIERAHGAGILHRDVKPANIFVLDRDRGVRLLDFGFSRMKTATPLTQVGTILGSPSYIAPEVWKGRSSELDHRVDVYSLGVILFRAIGGELPFRSESLQGAFVLATTAPRPSLRALRPGLSMEIDAWVGRALAIDRAERHGSVRELWNGFLKAVSYTPSPRPFRPVADSLVFAWKAATTAFRRFIDVGGDAALPDSRSEARASRRRPPPLPAVAPSASIDDEWELVNDLDIDLPPSQRGSVAPSERAPSNEWTEVTDFDVEPQSAGARSSAKHKPRAAAKKKKRVAPAKRKAAAAAEAARGRSARKGSKHPRPEQVERSAKAKATVKKGGARVRNASPKKPRKAVRAARKRRRK